MTGPLKFAEPDEAEWVKAEKSRAAEIHRANRAEQARRDEEAARRAWSERMSHERLLDGRRKRLEAVASRVVAAMREDPEVSAYIDPARILGPGDDVPDDADGDKFPPLLIVTCESTTGDGRGKLLLELRHRHPDLIEHLMDIEGTPTAWYKRTGIKDGPVTAVLRRVVFDAHYSFTLRDDATRFDRKVIDRVTGDATVIRHGFISRRDEWWVSIGPDPAHRN